MLIDLVEADSDPEIEISAFLTTEIRPFSFPIVRARVIRGKQKDILCINMNHTPTDGAGLKQFTKKLALTYTNLIKNQDFEVKPNLRGDRSLKQVTDNFSFLQKIKFTHEGFRSPKRGLTWSFDWTRTNDNDLKFISTMKIDSGIFDRIKVFFKAE